MGTREQDGLDRACVLGRRAAKRLTADDFQAGIGEYGLVLDVQGRFLLGFNCFPPTEHLGKTIGHTQRLQSQQTAGKPPSVRHDDV